MQQCTILYRCCILLSIFGITLSFYLPSMKSSRNHRTDSRISASQSYYRGSEGVRWQKRGDSYRGFLQAMIGHANLSQDKRIFVSNIFRLFDINGDGCINPNEFRSILVFLDIL